MANLGAMAAGATAVAGIVRTLTDPEMVERINHLIAGLRDRPKVDQAAALRQRAIGLAEQLRFLHTLVDNPAEEEKLAGAEARLRRLLASIPAAELASGGRKRAQLKRIGKALDGLTHEVITLMVGEAVEAEPRRVRRPTLRALRRGKGTDR